MLPGRAFALMLIVKCHVYQSQSSWSPYYHEGIPQDVMVDVVNKFALKLLAIHNENNDNNIAISPYGALSILVALGEGLRGEAVYEIQEAADIPPDISVIRIGLRDIHRHLKSYFIPDEGFLSGLTFNHENITLNREYEDILRFYGFDIETFNADIPGFLATTQASDSTAASTTTTESFQITSTQEGLATTTEAVDQQDTETSLLTDATTTESIAKRETITTQKSTETSTQPVESTTNLQTTEQTFTIVRAESTETSTQPVESTTNLQTTEQTSTILRAESTETSTQPVESTTHLQTTERTSTIVRAESTETSTQPVESTTNLQTTEQTSTIVRAESTETSTQPVESTTNLQTTEQTSTIVRAESTETSTQPVESTTNLQTEQTSAIVRVESISTTRMEESTTKISTTTQSNDGISTITPETIAESTIITAGTTTTGTISSTTQQEEGTAAINTVDNLIGTTQESSTVRQNRRIRSLVDYKIARYFDDQTITQRPPYYPEETYFLVNGKYKESKISFMTYDTVLPFHYISQLNALALRFPLDSSKYYLLLLLPEDDNGINRLICNLRLTSLKYIIKNLRYTHVKAVIPSFMLKGYIMLTSTLQKMGIQRVFEPRRSNFSPMTNQGDIYVTNIEQAITVTIRNYMESQSATSHDYLHQTQPVHFKADHPFLYFVIDSDIHVTLMEGKIVNPLNSRIK